MDSTKVSTKPAVEVLNEKIKSQHGLAGDAVSTEPIVIGIDGNEANVTQRVGSNMVAFKLVHALHELEVPYKFQIYLKHPPMDDMPRVNIQWEYRVIPMERFWTQVRLPFELYFGKGPTPDIFFSPGHYSPRWCPCPNVVTILDTAYLDFPEHFKQKDLLQLTQWTRRSVERAAHVVAISQHTKNDLVKNYKKSPDDITVAYMGVDHHRFTFPQADTEVLRVKKKYGITSDYVLYVGTLQSRKNLPRLIEAFKIASDKRKDRTQEEHAVDFQDLSLVIAGKKGWLYDDIFHTVQNLHMENRVLFTDYVPDKDLPGLMAGARCLALIALYEGFGIPVIEAMAVGTPSIVSNVSSLPEIIDHAGYKVDPKNVQDIAEKLGKMLDLSDQDYYFLVDKGLKHSQLFTWEHTAKTVLRVLEHAAGLPT